MSKPVAGAAPCAAPARPPARALTSKPPRFGSASAAWTARLCGRMSTPSRATKTWSSQRRFPRRNKRACCARCYWIVISIHTGGGGSQGARGGRGGALDRQRPARVSRLLAQRRGRRPLVQPARVSRAMPSLCRGSLNPSGSTHAHYAGATCPQRSPPGRTVPTQAGFWSHEDLLRSLAARLAAPHVIHCHSAWRSIETSRQRGPAWRRGGRAYSGKHTTAPRPHTSGQPRAGLEREATHGHA